MRKLILRAPLQHHPSVSSAPATKRTRPRLENQTRRHNFVTCRMTLIVLVMLMMTACIAAAPADPVRVDLPIYDQPDKGQPEVAVPLEMADDLDDRSDRTLAIFAAKVQAARNLWGGKYGHVESARAEYAQTLPRPAPGHHGPFAPEYSHSIFSAPVTSLEGVFMEAEDIASKQMTVKDNIHHFVAGFLQPKPLLDNIREEEKYGNTMDHAAGRAIVAGVEGVSNLVNSVLEVPGTILRKFSKAATEKLNNLGGRLIGL